VRFQGQAPICAGTQHPSTVFTRPPSPIRSDSHPITPLISIPTHWRHNTLIRASLLPLNSSSSSVTWVLNFTFKERAKATLRLLASWIFMWGVFCSKAIACRGRRFVGGITTLICSFRLRATNRLSYNSSALSQGCLILA